MYFNIEDDVNILMQPPHLMLIFTTHTDLYFISIKQKSSNFKVANLNFKKKSDLNHQILNRLINDAVKKWVKSLLLPGVLFYMTSVYLF